MGFTRSNDSGANGRYRAADTLHTSGHSWPRLSETRMALDMRCEFRSDSPAWRRYSERAFLRVSAARPRIFETWMPVVLQIRVSETLAHVENYESQIGQRRPPLRSTRTMRVSYAASMVSRVTTSCVGPIE